MAARLRPFGSARRLGSVLLALGLLCLGSVALAQTGLAAGGDPYVQLLAQAQRLDASGDVAGAAALLARAAPDYPTDFLLHLRLAYARFRLGEYSEALIAYENAWELSQGQRDAELGLGFTLQRLGRCAAALAHFEAVLARAPDDEAAREGVALCTATPVTSLQAQARLIGHAYVDHPVLSYALGLQAGLGGQLAPWLYLGALYRGTQFWSARGEQLRALTLQHELYVHAGLRSPRLGGELTYAYVGSGADYLSRVHVAGVTTWGWPLAWLGVWLEASGSFYADRSVTRVQPGISLLLGSHFAVRPTLSLQVWDRALLSAPALELSAHYEPLTVVVGGRLGEQRRPSFLSQPSVYNTDDIIGAGAWGVVELGLRRSLVLQLTYELQRRSALDPADDSRQEALAHFAVLGVRYESQ